MTKIVQLAGGDFEQQSGYTGPARELTVDESNWDLLLHDGVTPGGHRLMSQDNADDRYQAKSEELDGLTGFTANQRGFPVRLGAANYRIRKISFNDGNLLVENPDGYNGNPTFSLASTITTEHTWTGQQIFDDVVQFNAGINADVSGNTSGTHTGPVVGDVTGNVDGDLTGNSTGNHTGGVDVRGHSLQLDDNQIPTSAINGLQAFVQEHGFPAGAIVMWSGSVASIPAGWFLCNGLNATPDLRSKFIRGAGGVGFDSPGVTGGNDSVTPTATTASAGAHTHTVTGTINSGLTGITLSKVRKDVDISNDGNAMDDITLVDPGHTHIMSAGAAASAGAHAHDVTVNPVDNRPAYYALAYIMKG